MKKRAIVTVGVSDSRYFGPYLRRFKNTFREFGGADYLKIWHREWPPGSPTHSACHYAFKIYAILDALRKGYTTILWLDSSCNAFAPVTPLWDRIEREGHVLVEDDNALGKWSSDHSLATFGITRDEAMGIKLMCGTCVGLDLTFERSRKFLGRLHSYAKPEHFIGTHVSRMTGQAEHPRPGTEGWQMSNDERVSGHRSDEVYMSLIAHEIGMPIPHGREFIGGAGPEFETGLSCIRSGYDLPPPSPRPADSRHSSGLLDFGDECDAD